MKLPNTSLVRLIKEEVKSSQQTTELYKEFLLSINKINPDLNYKELAQAVATLLRQEYGTHNFKPFLSHLENILNLEETRSETR